MTHMQLTFTTYLIVLPLVFLAALVDSIGGGGGLISLPAYTLAGLSYDLASGCNKFSAGCATLTATYRFIRSGKIMWLPALCAMAGSLPASFLGTRVSMLLGNRFMNIFMICATPVVAAAILIRRKETAREVRVTGWRLFFCFLGGALMGFYDGFFGPGTGTFLIVMFTWVTGMDMVAASATSKPVNLASNIASVVTRLIASQVIFALAIPATCLSITGAWIGSKLALTKGAKFIRYVMLGVMALLMVKLIVDLFKG